MVNEVILVQTDSFGQCIIFKLYVFLRPMLKKILIQNYAIIDYLEIAVPHGLNIITGETGAGKSILLGALGLIMGKRADSKVLHDQNRKCIVEADFDIGAYNLKSFFEQEELDYEDALVIRREIAPGGKSRGFINDTPVNLDQLQQLTDKLIVIHQQFDMLDIQRPSFQLDVIDALAENKDLLEAYKISFRQFQALRKQLSELNQRNEASKNEADYLEFQLEELDKLNLKSGEQEESEQLLNKLSAAEDIKRITGSVAHSIEESEMSVTGQLREMMQQLDQIRHVDEVIDAMYQRLDVVYNELSDIAGESAAIAENTEFDEVLIATISERLNQIYRMLKKHNKADADALIHYHGEIKAKLKNLTGIEDDIKRIEKEIQDSSARIESLAQNISERRQNVTSHFEEKINEGIRQLGMEHGSIRVEVKRLSEYNATGIDEVSFLFAPNKGSKFQALKDIASGGEISRLTLCIKAHIAGTMTLPTLIFDEIDTGVSGEIARKMGSLLRELSLKHQVIAISHAPQIAATADTQFFVYKKTTDDRTVTDIRMLNPEERMFEIARMLSGDPPTPSALANAGELLGFQAN